MIQTYGELDMIIVAEENNFKCKPQEIETTHTIDVSKCISSLQEEINSEQFEFADLKASVSFSPQTKDNKDYCSLYIRLEHKEAKIGQDNRKVLVTIKCGTNMRSFCQIVSNFVGNNDGESCGYPEYLTTQQIAKCPLIEFSLKMNHDDQFMSPNGFRMTFQKQQISLYRLSKSEGDITLDIIIKNNDEDNDCLPIKSPPLKKRKLNDDIEVLSKTNEMRASSLILKSSSPVFKSILSNNMMEKKEKKIKVYAKSMDDVDNMLYFMCTNKLRDNANAINIIELANYYQMERLKFQCINKMIKSISVDNFAKILRVFDKYSITNGYHLLIEFGKSNLEELKQNDEFDQISHAFKMSALGMVQY